MTDPTRRTPPNRDFARRALAAAAALGSLVAISPPALAQGTGGRLPDPRSGPEVAAWLADAAGTPEERASDLDRTRLDAIWTAHEAYLADVERLRDGEIETWLETYPEEAFGPPMIDPTGVGNALDRAAKQAISHRRLFDRLAALEDAFWSKVGEILALDEAALRSLQTRGVRERALDLQGRRRFFGGVDPIDLAGVLERLEATPEEADRVRERLADHDGRLAEALAVAVESEFESSVRRAEQRLAFEAVQADRQAAIEAEVAAATAEGRPPDLEELMRGMVVDGLDVERPNARGANALLEQQLASLERLRGVLADERLAFLLSRLGHGGGDPLGRLFRRTIDEKIATGEIDAEAAAAIDAIREAYYRERVGLALELARLEGAGAAMRTMIVVDGDRIGGGPAERVDELRTRLGNDLPQQVRERLAGVVALEELDRQREAAAAGRARRGGAFEVGGASGTVVFETMPAQSIEFGVATVVATVDLAEADGDGAPIAFDGPVVMSFTAGEDGTFVLGAPRSTPPPLRPIAPERLAALLEDVALAEELRIVAEQLRADAATAYEEILRELDAALAADADAAKERRGDRPGVPMAMLGGNGANLERIDASLQRCLEVERAMFEALEALLDAEAAERLPMWRQSREAELFAAAAGLRGGGFDPDLGGGSPPWHGEWPRLDGLGIVLEAAPEALRASDSRDLLEDHIRRYREATETNWRSMRSMVPEVREARRAVFGNVAGFGENGDHDAIMDEISARNARLAAASKSLEESRSRVADLVREDLARLERALPDDSRRTLHAAVRRAAWPDAVPSMPGLSGIDRAASIAGDDEGVRTRLAEIEAEYLAESDRLFAMLDSLEVQPRRRAAVDVGGGFSPEGMRRWQSLSGRLRFRHGELDFETVRRLRDLVGPDRAEQIAWPRSTTRSAAPAEWF